MERARASTTVEIRRVMLDAWEAETPPKAVAQQHADPPATGLQAWEPSGADLGAKRHGQRRTGADTSGHYRTTRSRSGARRNTSFRELYSSRKPRMPGSSAVTPSGITSRPAGHYGTMPTSNDSLTNTATSSPAGSTPQRGQARQAAGTPGDRCHRRAPQEGRGGVLARPERRHRPTRRCRVLRRYGQLTAAQGIGTS